MEPTECIYYYSSSIKGPGFYTIKDPFQFQSNLKHSLLNWIEAWPCPCIELWAGSRSSRANTTALKEGSRAGPRTSPGQNRESSLQGTERRAGGEPLSPGPPGTVPADSLGARQAPGFAGLSWEPTNWVRGQFSSATQLYPTLCDPMDCSTPGFPVHHQLLEFPQTQVHWVRGASLKYKIFWVNTKGSPNCLPSSCLRKETVTNTTKDSEEHPGESNC